MEQIVSEAKLLCCHREQCVGIDAFDRLVVCLSVRAETFDLFFNSVNGYRAAYFRSPFDGIQGNEYFLARVCQSFEQNPSVVAECSGTQLLRRSIAPCSAKAWLAESETGLCSRCNGEWSPPQDDLPEILNGRWECGESIECRWGRKAPTGTKLRIIGAFTNYNSDEFIPKHKRGRARQIHEYGWA